MKKQTHVTNNPTSFKQELLNLIQTVEDHLNDINELLKQAPHDHKVMCAYRYYAHIHHCLKKQYESQYGNQLPKLDS